MTTIQILTIIGLCLLIVGLTCADCAYDENDNNRFVLSAIVASWGVVLCAVAGLLYILRHWH